MTVCFVMLAEVLIYLPSVARYTRTYFEDQIAKANLAALAMQASPDGVAAEPLRMDLLLRAGAHAIVLREPHRRMLMLSESMPPGIDVTYDMRRQSWFDWIGDAVATLVQRENRVLQVIAKTPDIQNGTIEVLLDETPLRRALYAVSWRILQVSVIISLITAGLVYLVLQMWMVRPIVRLTESMVRFRENPEDERTTIIPGRRGDEIGIAEIELAAMQGQLRAALRQKARLAALGEAVAKIHHDLRNTLSSAVLASDGLANIDNPKVQRLAPRLYQAIDRAVALTSRTLDYLRDEPPPLHETAFSLRDLLGDVVDSLPPAAPSAAPPATGNADFRVDIDELPIAELTGDREQLFRVFSNLVLNARQAGAKHVRISGQTTDGRIDIDISDNGPGIAPPVRERLFLPFAATNRKGGGTGLGLVITREIVAAHGGVLHLVETGDQGTTFRVELPLAPAAELNLRAKPDQRIFPDSRRSQHDRPVT
ncbi:MAG: HAMP domain-containing histidine kinase [Defluviicoccus sp.]|nr:MAG: HAMP domain-containing histidine kinase [Defluviicoccus sp.]